MKTPYLSICIPTNGRLEIIKKTLDSIYDNSKQVNLSDFEVVISDNSKNDDLLLVLDSFKQYDNISYFKADCEGFLNSVNALKCGSGLFLKLHNNHSAVNHFFLKETIDFIKREKNNTPQIFFTNGALNEKKIIKYLNFDQFSLKLLFFNTWSSGFSIWEKDFKRFENINYDRLFPQTTLLLELNNKNTYYVNDKVYFNEQEVPTKGGYNLFRAFAVDYVNIMLNAKDRNIISIKTFNKIKKKLIKNLLVEWYYKSMIKRNSYTFDLTGIKSSISVHYSEFEYVKFILNSYLFKPRIIIARAVKSLIGRS